MKRFLILGLLLAAGCAGNRPRGGVEVGQTPEQVEGTLGKPDRRFRRQTPSGDVETWGYMPFWPGFGIPAEPVATRGALASEIPLEPLRDDEDTRVYFKQGKVVAVETRRR
jgi:hypothetical protein